MTKSVSFAVEKRNCLTGLADAAKTAAIDRKYIQNICSALCAADHEHPEIGRALFLLEHVPPLS